MLNYSRDRNEGMYRSGEGEEGPLCDPGSELHYWEGAREYDSARTINGMKKKTNKQKQPTNQPTK